MDIDKHNFEIPNRFLVLVLLILIDKCTKIIWNEINDLCLITSNIYWMYVFDFPQIYTILLQRYFEWYISADIFSSNLATAPQARLFLSRVIKLLINATLSLPHPTSQAPFLSTIMLRLICLYLLVVSKHFIFSNKVDLSQERSVVILRKRLRWNIQWNSVLANSVIKNQNIQS